ncbi:MAG: glycoside hydrolase family 5 protein, partial [Oscillospiraceae bacterium]|nr:glycoside hydrolase family 5 protein [Oscillospiraceae bacterium]
MYKNEGYMAGANLGHWISQYQNQSHEHFRSYIQEKDIARMASWGMDHVRLPVDYFIFESDDKPGEYLESGLVYIDSCLEWCKKHGLNMVLDLHHAPGFFFGNGEKNCLMEDAAMQERYINIWRFFTKRYAGERDNIIFELLNELVADTSAQWNDLWAKTSEAIHALDPGRKIIVGGNIWNSVNELKNLTVSPNPNILYTFHMYHPMIFTHQNASWLEAGRRYNAPVEYPVDTAEHAAFYKIEQHGSANASESGILDKEYLRRVLAPAFEFIEKNKRPLYCGEYGVISHAPTESAVRWCDDLADLLLSYGI